MEYSSVLVSQVQKFEIFQILANKNIFIECLYYK